MRNSSLVVLVLMTEHNDSLILYSVPQTSVPYKSFKWSLKMVYKANRSLNGSSIYSRFCYGLLLSFGYFCATKWNLIELNFCNSQYFFERKISARTVESAYCCAYYKKIMPLITSYAHYDDQQCLFTADYCVREHA